VEEYLSLLKPLDELPTMFAAFVSKEKPHNQKKHLRFSWSALSQYDLAPLNSSFIHSLHAGNK